MFTACTQSRSAAALRVTGSVLAPRGGLTSAVTANSPAARTRASMPGPEPWPPGLPAMGRSLSRPPVAVRSVPVRSGAGALGCSSVICELTWRRTTLSGPRPDSAVVTWPASADGAEADSARPRADTPASMAGVRSPAAAMTWVLAPPSRATADSIRASALSASPSTSISSQSAAMALIVWARSDGA